MRRCGARCFGGVLLALPLAQPVARAVGFQILRALERGRHPPTRGTGNASSRGTRCHRATELATPIILLTARWKAQGAGVDRRRRVPRPPGKWILARERHTGVPDSAAREALGRVLPEADREGSIQVRVCAAGLLVRAPIVARLARRRSCCWYTVHALASPPPPLLLCSKQRARVLLVRAMASPWPSRRVRRLLSCH
jgi:hypothetical protein